MMTTGPCHAWARDAFRCSSDRLIRLSAWKPQPGRTRLVERERESQEALFELKMKHSAGQPLTSPSPVGDPVAS